MIIGLLLFGLGAGACAGSVPNLVIAASPTKEQASFSSGIQVTISGIGGITPVLAFVVLGRSAFSGPGGALVYTDSAITTSLLGCAVLAFGGAILLTTVLRPRADTLLAGDEVDEVQAELVRAQSGEAIPEGVLLVEGNSVAAGRKATLDKA